MEYFRDERNQVYADIAFRLGKIVVQYDQIETVKDKFDSTLHIAILQNLMTTCNEHVKQMTRSQRRKSIFYNHFKDTDWGLGDVTWESNFNEELTLQNFILRLRNSISHPLDTNPQTQFPNSGFSTNRGKTGEIENFVFINSPDVTKNRSKRFTHEHEIRDYLFDSKNRLKKEFPEHTFYEFNSKEKYFYISMNSRPFARTSIIHMSPLSLKEFLIKLSNFLAQPVEDHWDGVTIKNLFVA